MSQRENIFEKYRHAEDVPGDLAWANKQRKKSLKLIQDDEAKGILAGLQLSPDERALASLLKIPRDFAALEDCELLKPDEVRCLLRSLHAAELIALGDADQAKALVPIEIKRAKEAAAGKKPAAKKNSSKRLQARVYRPQIDGVASTENSDPHAFVPEGPITGGEAEKYAPAEVIAQAQNQDDQAYEAELEEVLQRYKNANHFEVLGLLSNADGDAVKKAYFDRAKRYHPDALSGHNFADRALAEKRVKAIFSRIGEAYQVLQIDSSRSEYRQRVEAGLVEHKDPGGRRRRPGEAHLQSKKAQAMLQKKDYAQARRMFTIAAELDFEDPTYPSFAAWCDYFDPKQDPDKRRARAAQQLKELLRKSPHAQTAYFVGIIAKMEDRPDEAFKMFTLALEIDPMHGEAARELRVLQARSDKQEAEAQNKSKGGFLDKIFKH